MSLKDLWEIGGIFGLAAGILWFAVRSLISFAYSKKTEIENLKNEMTEKSILELKDLTLSFGRGLHEIKEEIIRITEKIKNGQEAQKHVMEALEKFVEATNLRFKAIESEVVVLGKDLVMVKGTIKNRGIK